MPTVAQRPGTAPGKPMHRFHAEQWLPYPPDRCFAFFANPENLPRLMPTWQAARIESATFRPAPAPPEGTARPRTIVAGDGTEITLSFRMLPGLPLRQKWVARIGSFEWWHGFCDTQLSGPFFFWHHCHSLTPESKPDTLERGTRLVDDIEFGLPLEPFGNLALPLVRAQLRQVFAFRQKRTLELLEQMR